MSMAKWIVVSIRHPVWKMVQAFAKTEERHNRTRMSASAMLEKLILDGVSANPRCKEELDKCLNELYPKP